MPLFAILQRQQVQRRVTTGPYREMFPSLCKRRIKKRRTICPVRIPSHHTGKVANLDRVRPPPVLHSGKWWRGASEIARHQSGIDHDKVTLNERILSAVWCMSVGQTVGD
jgi:hypothetical protein